MKTKYKVLAQTGYAGHTQGEEFEAELDEAAERRALERGSIKKLTGKQTAKKEEEKADG
jgi:hypothetical protein